MKNSQNLSKITKSEIDNILMESIWIMQWTDNKKQAMYAVLTVKESEKILSNIKKNLKKKGYSIIKKSK